jgi:hypothetical protein
MKKEFVPYDIALAMKELGFEHDGECPFITLYNKKKLEIYTVPEDNIFSIASRLGEDETCLAPLYQQAFRWFREEHGLWVTFEYYDCDCVDDDICWYIGKCFREGIGPLFLTNELGDFKTKEEAELACLRKLIEIVKK